MTKRSSRAYWGCAHTHGCACWLMPQLCFYTVGYKVAFANMGEYSVPGFHGATGSVSKQVTLPTA
jgi:hypothetical protein